MYNLNSSEHRQKATSIKVIWMLLLYIYMANICEKKFYKYYSVLVGQNGGKFRFGSLKIEHYYIYNICYN